MCFTSTHTPWERSFSLKLNSVKRQCPDPIVNFSPLKDLNRHASSLCLETTGSPLRQQDVQGAHLLQKVVVFFLSSSICKYLETHYRDVEIIFLQSHNPTALHACTHGSLKKYLENITFLFSIPNFFHPLFLSFSFLEFAYLFLPHTSYSSASLLDRGQGFTVKPTSF